MQLVVKYNRAIDAAGDEDNYALTTDGTAVIDASSDFDLSDDGMTVTITLTTAADQQEVVDLTITDILDEETDVENIEFLDVTIPTVTSAEVVGNDTIKVYFSEPMITDDLEGVAAEANYSVVDADGDKLYVDTVAAGTNNMSALVTLFADIDGDVTVTVDDVLDFEGFSCIETSITVSVAVDETAPTVVSYEDADENSVVLVFDNDIEEASDAENADFYHTNESTEVSSYSISGNELTLTWADGDEMPVGTAYVYVKADALNDLWDNDNDKITVEVTVVVDETEPTVVGDVDVTSQDTIEVDFSEDVNVDGDDFEVTLLDEDGDESSIELDTAEVDADDSSNLIFTFDDDLYGNYTVVIEGVEDTAGNEADKVNLEFYVDDETAPVATDFEATIYNAGTADQKVVIDFKEEMDADDVTNKALYFYGSTSLDDSDVTITVIDDGEGVEIDAPAADTVTMAHSNNITIGRVKDAAGNELTTLTGAINLANGDAETVALDSVEMTAVDTIVITVDGTLTDIDVDQFSFEAVDSATDLGLAKVKTGEDSDGNTTITFTLSVDLATDATSALTDATAGKAINYIIGANAGSNAYGQDLVTVADATATVADTLGGAIAEDADGVAQITTVDSDATPDGRINAVVVEYDEAVNADTISLLSYEVEDYTITSVDVSDDGVVDGTYTGTGVYVVLTVTEITSGTDTDVTPSVTQLLDIEDASSNGNTIEATSGDAAIDAVDALATLTAPEAGAQTELVVTFSEDLHADTLAIDDIADLLSAAANDHTGTDTAIAVTTVADSVVWSTVDGSPVATITIPSTTFVATQEVAINFKADAVKDLAGNAIPATLDVVVDVVAAP